MASVVPPAPGPRVSLRDIGLKLGVSHVTVSLARTWRLSRPTGSHRVCRRGAIDGYVTGKPDGHTMAGSAMNGTKVNVNWKIRSLLFKWD